MHWTGKVWGASEQAARVSDLKRRLADCAHDMLQGHVMCPGLRSCMTNLTFRIQNIRSTSFPGPQFGCK
jgi:hypothetical protein